MRHAALVSILCAALAGGGVQGFDTVDCLWGHACPVATKSECGRTSVASG